MVLLLLGSVGWHLRAQSVSVDYIHSVPTCVGQEIQFWALPSPPDGPYRKLWDYGDGSILTLADEHTFNSPGTYTVRLDLMDTLTWTLAASVTYDLDVGLACDSAYFIKGRVYYDENDDWTLSPGETGYPGVILRADPGPYYAISGSDGKYALGLPEGTYTVSADVSGLSGMHPNQPAAWSYAASFSGPYSSSTGNDFGIAPDSLFTDLDVDLPGWLAVLVPGVGTPQFLNVCNQGTTVVSGKAGLVLPEFAKPGAALPSYYNTMGDTVEWHFPPLPPGHCKVFSIKTRGDSTLMLGETFKLYAYGRTPGDSRLTNNLDSVNGTVMTSYDPNDKSVLPAGEGPEHQVDTTDEWFHYNIRFQNLGTGPAIDIRIKDSLDASVFDIGSFHALGGTHPYKLDIRGNAVVTWSFDGIYLPHADDNEADSDDPHEHAADSHDDDADHAPHTHDATVEAHETVDERDE